MGSQTNVSKALSQLSIRIVEMNRTKSTIDSIDAKIHNHMFEIEKLELEREELIADSAFCEKRIEHLVQQAYSEGYSEEYVKRFIKERLKKN